MENMNLSHEANERTPVKSPFLGEMECSVYNSVATCGTEQSALSYTSISLLSRSVFLFDPSRIDIFAPMNCGMSHL
ncbi:expressed protein [Echinococcus multilocularis]|uniref:Expressed protein n=1 Tax=Echinococcus multilocularis TaxID=6211 RepID=A0A068YHE2_ECHMU|nr:expressed protein [Echinococcus multilocularis]